MKLFYNSDGTAKVLPVSSLPANAVWNGGFPYTPEGSLLVSIVSAKPTDTVSNGGFIQELWGGVCAGYGTPSVWIGGLAVTSYGALCLDVDGGIVTDGPVFYNSLTHSLIPTRGALTPSFTRASTATFTDWEGVLRTVPSGCARFEGARMVYNLWTTSSATLANGANKSLTLAAGTYTFSMGAGTGTATFSGTGGATGTLAASASGRVEVTKTITAGTFVVTASVADLVDLQVEYVTGQADQTASEYVSVGVPSDWAGDELVTNGNFSDGTTGWTAGNSAVLASVNGELRITNGTNLNGYAYQEVPIVVGQKYVVTTTARCGTAILCNTNLGSTLVGSQYGSVATASTSNVPLNTVFTATGTTLYLAVVGDATNGNTVFFDNISVKPAIYHGAGVDGVEFFNTDRDGAVIPAATNTGYLAETADVLAHPTASNILAAASTVYVEFTPDHTPSGTIALWGTYVDASNYTAILHDATNMIMRKRIAGVNYDATIANAFTANTTYKVCGSWGAAGVTVTLDGTEGTLHANTTAAQIAATMQWGADGNSLQQPFATERNARVWQRQLSAPEGVAVTA